MANNRDNTMEPFCAFCGKPASMANAMVSGPDGINICDECVAICAEAIVGRGGKMDYYGSDDARCHSCDCDGDCGDDCTCGHHGADGRRGSADDEDDDDSPFRDDYDGWGTLRFDDDDDWN